MRLDNQELNDLLIEKDILLLYHANTLATSITYLEQGGLLSRGEVDTRGLYQSPQKSDPIDKVVNVFNDIFLDTIDLHEYFNRQNHYGPILFCFEIDFLVKEDFEVWITKNNPMYWNSTMSDKDKYFESVAELRNEWDNYERQKKMLTIRNQNEPILFEYLNKVIVDDPRRKIGETVLFNEAKNALKNVLSTNKPLKNRFKTRACSSCYCRSNYLHQVVNKDLKRLFLPK